MDALLRRTFVVSAGYLFASVGFTMSILTMFFYLFFPRRPTQAINPLFASRISNRKGREQLFLKSGSSTPERLLQTSQHHRRVSDNVMRKERAKRPRKSHRRSESTPPSPSPSHQPDEYHSESVDLSIPFAKSDGMSFRHRNRLRRSPSAPSGSAEFPVNLELIPPVPSLPNAPLLQKSKSHLFVPFIHRRHSQSFHEEPDASASLDSPPTQSSVDQMGKSSLEKSDSPSASLAHQNNPSQSSGPQDASQDVSSTPQLTRSASRILRTNPYEAPFNIPTPSVKTYVSSRRRSRSVPKGGLERRSTPKLPAPPLPHRKPSGDFLSVPTAAR
ncbi:hypothetical protein C8J57DRAFT_5479 [Mycena rebaudengoi]|nr:hypothetical protein C8J57DRAFT_5479 [Mycena rebaudengoi]